MKICVMYSKHCNKSAKALAKALGADANNISLTGRRDFTEYDLLLSYGCSAGTAHKRRLNLSNSILACIDKVETFKALNAANIPTVEWTTNPADTVEWDVVVCREKLAGKANKGMTYVYQGEELPECPLYTKYFHHKCEYRVVVFQGAVIGRYRKDIDDNGDWEFTKMLKRGFEDIDSMALKAAKALNIDFVGFDVLANKRGKVLILEANSGPVLTDDVAKAIVKKLRN
jgi:glutathione synthase/RimK-type ligase-like ATP-grasp enzyme